MDGNKISTVETFVIELSAWDVEVVDLLNLRVILPLCVGVFPLLRRPIFSISLKRAFDSRPQTRRRRADAGLLPSPLQLRDAVPLSLEA